MDLKKYQVYPYCSTAKETKASRGPARGHPLNVSVDAGATFSFPWLLLASRHLRALSKQELSWSTLMGKSSRAHKQRKGEQDTRKAISLLWTEVRILDVTVQWSTE